MDEIKIVIEALLFATSEPLGIQKIKQIVRSTHDVSIGDISKALDELQQEYQTATRAFELHSIAEGYILRTKPAYHSFISQLFKSRRTEKLKAASLETLAIIAYKQPITRAEVEEIRGVDSSGIISQLHERGLIESVGTLQVPGKPTLFGTTSEFLKRFGPSDWLFVSNDCKRF